MDTKLAEQFTESPPVLSALERAVEICGGQTALASSLGLRQGNVWSWINRFGNKVPPEYVLSVAAAIDWKLTPHQLRPDIYPHPLDGLPENLRPTAARSHDESVSAE